MNPFALPPKSTRVGFRPPPGLAPVAVAALTILLLSASPLAAQVPLGGNEGGITDPALTATKGEVIKIPNTDQSADGVELTQVEGDIVYEDTTSGTATSMLGHTITHVASPNYDMRVALQALERAADLGDTAGMTNAADELRDILLGTTQGRIYDGFSMLNFNRYTEPSIPGSAFPPGVTEGEYKTRVAVDTGETFVSPYDGEERKIWEVDINHLYYDGQIDADTFLVHFKAFQNASGEWELPHPDDTLRVNYHIYSLVEEDFSPTLVMLDKRLADNTVQFPFKGYDAVWVPFKPGEKVTLSVNYPPIRQVRGIYDWGWRVHPPRIQFVQPIYDMINQHTGLPELDPQGESFAFRNRELTIDKIADAAPEKKMYQVAEAVLDGTPAEIIHRWLTEDDEGPRGTWVDWADLVTNQRQLPDEAWDVLSQEDGLSRGSFGDFKLVSVFMNNEMYGDGPDQPEIERWLQGERLTVKLINLDHHTHYFRNVDFGARVHDDILRCCGGGFTSFEIMNFKPSFGAPKVAEAQWRAGWGFRPHYDVIQQQDVFSRPSDRIELKPYTGGDGDTHYGYRYSAEHRGGDFRFNPPPFIITDIENPAQFPLRDSDGQDGLLVGQFTPGYGTGQMCPNDPFPGFCTTDISANNPHAVLNFPPPPLQGQPVLPPDVGKFPNDVYPDHPVELRFPPFLRNPAQGQEGAGDIIPPTGAWRPFLWYHPINGTLFNDPNDPSKGFWADYTYSHGAPVFAGGTLDAVVEAPRSAAQVFYQFDDLFHDNDIFSPHPVFASFDFDEETDHVARLRARLPGGNLKVDGYCTEQIETRRLPDWISIHSGASDESGCPGPLLGVVPVDDHDGSFSFTQNDSSLVVGDTVCVQTVIGGFDETTISSSGNTSTPIREMAISGGAR